MYILGIHNDEDSGVCLIKNGILQDVVNEERFTRKKLQGGFPTNCIKYVLKKNKISIKEIDHFTYGWHGRQNNYFNYINKLFNRLLLSDIKDKKIQKLILERLRVEFAKDDLTFKKFLNAAEKFDIPKEKTHFFDHHSSHAWSAFSCSPFNESLVFTMDARGDLKSSSVSKANIKNGLKEVSNNLSFDSLGYLYGQITYYLGFKPHRHEGKVTGLAAYGNPSKTKKIFNKLIKWDGTKIVSNLGYYRPFFTNLSHELVRDLKKHSREDIAAGVQDHCEKIIVQYVKFWINKISKNKKVNVCLAGGIFANVKINQKVDEIKNVKNLYVFPHMGDGGLTVGAACQQNYKINKKAKVNLQNVNYGPMYTSREIHKVLKKFKNKIDFYKSKNLSEDVYKLLIKNKVIGFFNGRMEFGPRALGSRSILFHTKDRSSNKWLNDRLRRTEFMPFAPVTLERLASKCFKNWNKDDYCSKFMTKTYDCTKDFIKNNPAVVHVDGTARPQVVNKEFNKIYYKVLDYYFKKSNNNALINTSFNQHEQPIVCSPLDAINSLLSNNIDYLIIENFIVVKN